MSDRMTNAEIEALCQWIEEGAEAGMLGAVIRELYPEKLTKALTAIRQLQQPWQGIESAPRDGTWVWGFYPLDNVPDQQTPMQWREDGWDGDPAWVDAAEHRDWTQPTAWMPLPPEPGQ